jgi:hypothetical protein
MPSGEEFSSGFEEEFERARLRNQNKGQPEIWLALWSRPYWLIQEIN